MDVHHQIAAGRVLHHEADVRVRLEAGEQVDEERVAYAVGHFEDALLAQQRFDLVAGDYVAFLEGLYGEILARVAVLGQDHFAEVAAAQHADQSGKKHLIYPFIFKQFVQNSSSNLLIKNEFNYLKLSILIPVY